MVVSSCDLGVTITWWKSGDLLVFEFRHRCLRSGDSTMIHLNQQNEVKVGFVVVVVGVVPMW